MIRVSVGQFAATLSALFLASVASAQAAEGSTEAKPQEARGGLQEIVVTAQKRADNLQSVPLSVAAFDAEALETRGVTGTDFLSTVVPGLIINRQARYSLPFLRGVGSQSGVIGNENAVATYVDGIYNADPVAANMSFNNIERIEVLRGPQGTLFGRNATGGLINIITRDPVAAPSAEVSASYGNYQTFEGRLYATGGTEKLAADVALYTINQGEGFGKYILVPGEPDAGYREMYAARSKLLWTPTEEDKLTLIAQYADSQSDIGLSRTAAPGSVLFGGFAVQGSPYDSTNGSVTDISKGANWGAALRYERAVGSATLTVISAYQVDDLQQFYDNDSQPARLTDVDQFTKSRSLQNEIYVNGASERLDWTVGAFVFDLKSSQYPLGIRSTSFLATNYNIFADQFTKSYAAYAQGTYALNDATHVTAGIRYTVDSREFSGTRIAVAGNPSPAGTVLETGFGSSDDDRPTWRLALDRQLTDDTLAYVSYNRGFKSGTFNLTNLAAPAVGPETLDAYEVGIKSELFERTLRLNVAGFYYDYRGIQLTTTQVGVTSYFNAAEGRVQGAEAEMAFAPRIATGDLLLNVGLSWLDGEYAEFPNGQITTPRPQGGNLQTLGDLSGRAMIRSPEWTASVAVDYTVPVGSNELSLNAAYYHNDGFFWDPDNRLAQDAYGIASAELSFAFGANRQYRVRAFGKNITDEEYFFYMSGASLADVAAAGDPRTYGVGFDVTF